MSEKRFNNYGESASKNKGEDTAGVKPQEDPSFSQKPETPGSEEKGLLSHEQILLKKLEAGEPCGAFDSSTVELLDNVLRDASKKGIVGSRVFRSVAEWIIPKVAGVSAGVVAMNQGSKYVGNAAREYLKERMLFDTSEKAEKAAETVIPSQAPTEFWSGLKETLTSLAINARDALIHATEEAKRGGETAVNYASESFINTIAGPAAEALSKPPLAVGGFLLGAGIVGGGVGVYRAMRERSGFGPIAKMIKQSGEIIESGERPKVEKDARINLIAYFKSAAQDSKHLGHKLSREEWLMFAGAARAARASLLRDMTRAPRIVAERETGEGMERQERVVEEIIRSQRELAAEDMQLATEVLAQFDTRLAQDMDPIKQKLKSYNMLLPKVGTYSRAFVRGGFNATGIPMAWRMVKFGGRSAHKIARIATFGAIP